MGRLEFANDVRVGWARLRPDVDLHDLSVVQKLIWSGRLAERLLERVARQSGLRRRGDYEILALLRRSEPRMVTPAELAEQLLTSPSGMTGKIDRLENLGLLERTPDESDRRAINLQLTPQGKALVDDAFDDAMELYRGVLSGLTNEESVVLDGHLTVLLDTLEHLSAMRQPWTTSDH